MSASSRRWSSAHVLTRGGLHGCRSISGFCTATVDQVLSQPSTVKYPGPLFHVIENTVVANSTYRQKKCKTFKNNTHSNAENLIKQAEHCHTFDDIDTLGAGVKRLNILAIDTFTPIAYLLKSSYVCAYYVHDQIQVANGRILKNIWPSYWSAY